MTPRDVLIQAVKFQPLKVLVEVIAVFIKGEAGKQHVVYVCKDEIETSADFVHETLE